VLWLQAQQLQPLLSLLRYITFTGKMRRLTTYLVGHWGEPKHTECVHWSTINLLEALGIFRRRRSGCLSGFYFILFYLVVFGAKVSVYSSSYPQTHGSPTLASQVLRGMHTTPSCWFWQEQMDGGDSMRDHPNKFSSVQV
jgi:hypothetical protein